TRDVPAGSASAIDATQGSSRSPRNQTARPERGSGSPSGSTTARASPALDLANPRAPTRVGTLTDPRIPGNGGRAAVACNAPSASTGRRSHFGLADEIILALLQSEWVIFAVSRHRDAGFRP